MSQNKSNDPRLQPAGTAVQRAASPTAKYRPSLTATQIEHILYLAKTHQEGLVSDSINLIATLAPFQAKIQNSGITAAYITQQAKPSVTSLEALGETDPAAAGIAASAVVCKEVYWEQCYKKVIANPEECSLDEIYASQEHRYLNDLMSPEEEHEHEQQNN